MCVTMATNVIKDTDEGESEADVLGVKKIVYDEAINVLVAIYYRSVHFSFLSPIFETF